MIVFTGRAPSTVYNEAISVDEAQMLAQAMTLTHYPVPWKSWDPNSSGPLNSLILDLPRIAGLTPSYLSGRLIASALIVVMLFCLCDIVSRAFGRLAGRLSTLPALTFLALDSSATFSDYPTELLSVALIAIGADLAFSATPARGRLRLPRILLGGLVLGCVPFGKLQALPFAVVIAGAVIVSVARKPLALADRRRAISLFLVSCLLLPAALLDVLLATGSFSDFFTSYVVSPLYYVRENGNQLTGMGIFFRDGALPLFFAGCGSSLIICALVLLVGIVSKANSFQRVVADRALIGFFLAMIATAIYAIELPHTRFVHYVLLLVFPLCGLVGSIAGLTLLSFRRRDHGRALRGSMFAIASVLTACMLLPPLYVQIKTGNEYQGEAYVQGTYTSSTAPPTKVYSSLRVYVRPGERMAIWGWAPQYYVATGTIMGTRDAICQFQIEPRSLISYYRSRYLSDMNENVPEYFLDAVSPISFAFTDRSSQGFETFPELRRLISRSYHLVSEVDGLRLYERNHRERPPELPV